MEAWGELSNKPANKVAGNVTPLRASAWAQPSTAAPAPIVH